MAHAPRKLQTLIDRAQELPALRVAVVCAAQRVVLETVHKATALGLITPTLIGDAKAIRETAAMAGLEAGALEIIDAKSDAAAANEAVGLARNGKVDALMKGQIHTDTLMRALLDSDHGLRLPGRRVSHAFVCEIPSYPSLLVVTDAAINIAPDLNAKAQILQNAIGLSHLIGVERPRAAVLSAVETVNLAIASTVDAACLAVMAQRGQISGAVVDGPLAFDNAISVRAAKEKGIGSAVAGHSDILLVPDLVSGNILAKNLEYLSGATVAGIVLGLSVPLVLTSRSDPEDARLAALALAVLMHAQTPTAVHHKERAREPSLQCAPQPEAACCPLSG
ncbi:MAG: bifunctional enoyl-CoA hydratase/phosphate acetyltransferase [Hyphomonadaceae bacterium]|jgi:phosphotransacetylase|nr:bifunctional enoyl-CoA hydratase/phosphate acetyltransferase [Hyphomonadaceae bacterium]